jgi:O-antigen/teichoic acid export membrane protein
VEPCRGRAPRGGRPGLGGRDRYLSAFTGRQQTALALATLKLALLVEATVAVRGFGLVWLTAAWVATWFFSDPSLEGLILLGALTLVTSTFDRTARAALRVFDRFGTLGVCSAVEAIGRLLLVVVAVSAGAQARGVQIAHLTADLAGGLLLLTFAGREARERLWSAHATARLGALRPYRREMLAFMGHSTVRATLKVATRRLDLLLLGHFGRRRKLACTARPFG